MAYGCTHGEEEGLLSLCDDDSSTESSPDTHSAGPSAWDPSDDPSALQSSAGGDERGGERDGECGGERGGERSSGGVTRGAVRWDIDAPDNDDAWLLTTHKKDAETCPKERQRVQRAKRRVQGRMRSSVETGPPVFMSQTLFGRIMCGMQDRAPGVLQDALIPDLRDAFTPF